LDKATQAQLSRGQRLTEILKQDQFAPFSVQKQVLSLFVATSGVIDNIPVDQVRRFESEFIQFVENNNAGILKTIAEKQALDDGIKADIKKAADTFKEGFMASIKDAAPAAPETKAPAGKAPATKAPASDKPTPAPAK
jgi:F-type H+-transporting ATPase subunit alpha